MGSVEKAAIKAERRAYAIRKHQKIDWITRTAVGDPKQRNPKLPLRMGKVGFKRQADGTVKAQDDIQHYVLPAGSAPTRKTRNRQVNAIASTLRYEGHTRRAAREIALATVAHQYGEI